MTTAVEAIADLVTVIDNVLGDEWTVYGWPPAAPPSWPAAVVYPRGSWSSMSYCTELLQLGVDMLNPLTQGQAGFAQVDAARIAVRDALGLVEGVRYESTDPVARNVAGIDAYGVTLNLDIPV